MTSLKYKTGEEYYNKVYLIFNVLIAITLVPFVILFLEIEKYGAINKIVDGTSEVLISTLLIASFISVFYYSLKDYKRKLSEISENISLREKLDHYYSVVLRRYFGLTICCGLAVLGLFLTKYFLYIIAYVLALIILSIGRPVLSKIIKEIPLNQSEIEILNKKDTIG